MSKRYTTGPLYATASDEFIRVRRESDDAVLATMEDGTHPELELIPWDEQMANARLYAASSDLLEALQAMLEWGGADGTYHALKYAKAVDSARAAIAKAEGGA